MVSRFWYTGDQEIMETDASGATARRYVRIPGSVNETLMMIDYTLPVNDNERWSHANRLGSTVMVSNGAGTKVEEFTYSAYGITGAAILYSLIETAKLNNVNPQAWLADVVTNIQDHKINKLDELLPWNWEANKL